MGNFLSMMFIECKWCQPKTVCALIIQIGYWLATQIFKVLGLFADLLNIGFYIFSGIDVSDNGSSRYAISIASTGEKKNILDYFVMSQTMRQAYLWLALLGLLLIVVFTIYKIIKQDYFEKAGPRSKGPIFRNVAISCISFLLVIPIFWLIIHASSWLALQVMATLGMDIDILAGAKIFSLSFSDGGEMMRFINNRLNGDADIHKFSWMFKLNNDTLFTMYYRSDEVVWDTNINRALAGVTTGEYKLAYTIGVLQYDESGATNSSPVYFYWYIYLVGVVVGIKTLYKLLLAMLQRVFMLMGLFLVAPSPISQYVLDDGAKFKDWLKTSIQQGLRLVVATMSFGIYLIVLNLITDIDFVSAFTNAANQSGNAEDAQTVIPASVNPRLLSYNGNLTRGVNSLAVVCDENVLGGTYQETSCVGLDGRGNGVLTSMANAFMKIFVLMGAGGAVSDLDPILSKFISGASGSLEAGETGKGANAVANAAKKGLEGAAKLAVTGAAGVAKAVGKGIAKGTTALGGGLAKNGKAEDAGEALGKQQAIEEQNGAETPEGKEGAEKPEGKEGAETPKAGAPKEGADKKEEEKKKASMRQRITNSDTYNAIFGKKDKDGNRKGGVAGWLKDAGKLAVSTMCGMAGVDGDKVNEFIGTVGSAVSGIGHSIEDGVEEGNKKANLRAKGKFESARAKAKAETAKAIMEDKAKAAEEATTKVEDQAEDVNEAAGIVNTSSEVANDSANSLEAALDSNEVRTDLGVPTHEQVEQAEKDKKEAQNDIDAIRGALKYKNQRELRKAINLRKRAVKRAKVEDPNYLDHRSAEEEALDDYIKDEAIIAEANKVIKKDKEHKEDIQIALGAPTQAQVTKAEADRTVAEADNNAIRGELGYKTEADFKKALTARKSALEKAKKEGNSSFVTENRTKVEEKLDEYIANESTISRADKVIEKSKLVRNGEKGIAGFTNEGNDAVIAKADALVREARVSNPNMTGAQFYESQVQRRNAATQSLQKLADKYKTADGNPGSIDEMRRQMDATRDRTKRAEIAADMEAYEASNKEFYAADDNIDAMDAARSRSRELIAKKTKSKVLQYVCNGGAPLRIKKQAAEVMEAHQSVREYDQAYKTASNTYNKTVGEQQKAVRELETATKVYESSKAPDREVKDKKVTMTDRLKMSDEEEKAFKKTRRNVRLANRYSNMNENGVAEDNGKQVARMNGTQYTTTPREKVKDESLGSANETLSRAKGVASNTPTMHQDAKHDNIPSKKSDGGQNNGNMTIQGGTITIQGGTVVVDGKTTGGSGGTSASNVKNNSTLNGTESRDPESTWKGEEKVVDLRIDQNVETIREKQVKANETLDEVRKKVNDIDKHNSDN